MTGRKRIAMILFSLLLPIASQACSAEQKGNTLMNANYECGDTALGNTLCMIESVIKDVRTTYTQVGGGGVTEIKMVATNIYRVAISQEERVDLITYELEITPERKVVIKKRTEGTRTYGQ